MDRCSVVASGLAAWADLLLRWGAARGYFKPTVRA